MNIDFLKTLAKTTSITLLFILLFNGFSLKAQTISLKIEDEPLNNVLVLLRDQHGLKFSFDHELLSGYRISLNRSFANPDEAVHYLVKDLPLKQEKLDGVYIIYPEPPGGDKSPGQQSVIQGIVSDAYSGESLPYSHIVVNDINLIADGQGRFSSTHGPDSVFRVQVSYLGYYNCDTTLYEAGNHVLQMIPSVLGIKEVVVKNKGVRISTMSKLQSGEMRLNHKVGSYLPGFADNALYNLLRLQPGVLAAGEQSNDLIIWGSYSGQTEVLFDGMTLFGLKNYNDNIGIVNPYMVKDVKLMKGGYPAEYGGKAGGIVDISGISGNRNKPELILSATNMTLNSRLSLPVGYGSSFNVAFRQTYYNLYKNSDLNLWPLSRRQEQNMVDLSVVPDYMFRDITVKYAGNTSKGDNFYVDFLRGTDQFDYLVNYNRSNNLDIYSTVNESNTQTGSSIFYGKVWQNGNTTDLSFSYSELSNKFLNEISIKPHNKMERLWRYDDIQNNITRIKAGFDNHIKINANHSLDFGADLGRHQITLDEDSLGHKLYSSLNKSFSIESYAQDRISLENGLNIIAGIRVDFPLYLKKALIQPRLSMNYELAQDLWIKAAWGKYDQFVVQSSVLDDAGNYRYFWALSDGEEVPVQSAKHLTAGFSYQKSLFSFGVEAYRKKLTGLTRYLYLPNRIDKDVYTGEGFSRGIDVLLEMKIKKHQAWFAYSLSQTLERFSYFKINTYLRAPQDQRHEFKTALLLDFHPFYVSTNFVYGSGFPDRSLQAFLRKTTDLKYTRWDISAIYRLSLKRFNLHTGISILNVLNSENIKLQNFVKIPDSQGASINILAEAVPFTPTLFLILEF